MSLPALPDSPIAIASRDYCREFSSVGLTNHCERTYVFAAELGTRQNETYDPELLYVASMLHDLGLTERFDGPEEFEVQGANAAHAFLLERGWDEPKAGLVREAITWHTKVGTEDHERREVPLLRLGAGIDVLGLGIEDLPPEVVDAAINRFPRAGVKAEFIERFADQGRRKPESWMALLIEGLDWLQRIEDAPFEE